jgi:WD40 repeat protein
MPVDAAVFAGVPSVTALKPLPKANVLLAAAMDRRVVCCDLAAEGKGAIKGKHHSWSHDNWIHDLDIHPDGERVATGGTDRHIKIWKWGEDASLAAFKAHDDCVRAVCFSPNGDLLASAGDDGKIRLWDVATAKEIATLDPRGSFLDTLAWCIDGKRLFSSGRDGKVHAWEIEQKAAAGVNDIDNRRDIEDEPLNGGFSYPGGVRRLTCSPDGKLLAAVGLKSLNVADAATGKERFKVDGRGFGVAFDPTSRWLAFSQEKDVLIWDLQANGVSHKIVMNQLGIFAICFLNGGKQLAAGGCNGVVGVWDLST